jgi:hypothetical protein
LANTLKVFDRDRDRTVREVPGVWFFGADNRKIQQHGSSNDAAARNVIDGVEAPRGHVLNRPIVVEHARAGRDVGEGVPLTGNLREVVIEDVIEAFDVLRPVAKNAVARETTGVVEGRVEKVKGDIEREGNATTHETCSVGHDIVRDQIDATYGIVYAKESPRGWDAVRPEWQFVIER